jgi:hypothetical protein
MSTAANKKWYSDSGPCLSSNPKALCTVWITTRGMLYNLSYGNSLYFSLVVESNTRCLQIRVNVATALCSFRQPVTGFKSFIEWVTQSKQNVKTPSNWIFIIATSYTTITLVNVILIYHYVSHFVLACSSWWRNLNAGPVIGNLLKPTCYVMHQQV